VWVATLGAVTSKLDHSRVLELLEQRQREEAPAPQALAQRETSRVRIPADGAIPQSRALLERLYQGGVVPREKKPQVIDTRRSSGPYLVSIDDAPMVVLDACSQIATLTHGFAHPGVLAGLHEGRFETCLWANPDSTVAEVPELEAYAALLLDKAPAGLEQVAFVGAGGAEANEKAFRIARLHAGPRADGSPRKRVLAFEGSFHGRTFVALGATYNPAKRIGVDMPGYEAVFCRRDLGELERVLAEHGDELYAAIVEPMMAEGGDVYLDRAFLLGVREQTRAHGIPLIVDEVQTGFGTGGPFFWWSRLGLGDTPETAPDLLTSAKRAGLGVVLSRWPDPEPTAVNVASALRGLIHAETGEDQAALEAPIKARLDTLMTDYATRISNPRVAGSCFAFDVADSRERDAFINQRFARGFMTYYAGERTIRFRLAACWEPRHLDQLFARVRVALDKLDDPHARAFVPEGRSHSPRNDFEIRRVCQSDWPAVMAIENQAYEAARADSEFFLRRVARQGLGLVAAEHGTGQILGFVFGAALEHFGDVAGPDSDDLRGTGRGFYAADLTIAEGTRGRGVGRALKRTQLEWARDSGFDFVSGRNRIGATEEMAALNRSMGAYTSRVLEGQYEGSAQAEYYRVPLRPPTPAPLRPPTPAHLPVRDRDQNRDFDLGSGIQAPFGPRPAFMASRELVGPTASRLNLSNWATLDTVHYVEHLRAILPRGTSHLYTTTSRDELVSKALRCLKMNRPAATLAIGLDGGYVGHNTATARSLSDPAGFGLEFAFYDWPRLPHPETAGIEATLAALEQHIESHGAEAIIAVFVELVGERSGLVLDGPAALALAALAKTHAIPLVAVETATGGYRSGAGPWGLDALPATFLPNMVLWYPGGQLGQIFVDSTWWVATPLRLISTWDGDELSMIRVHEHLRAAHRLDLSPAIAALDALVREASSIAGHRARVGGVGLYRTLNFGDEAQAAALRTYCRDQGLILGVGAPGILVFAPALDIAPADIRGPLRATLLEGLAAISKRASK